MEQDLVAVTKNRQVIWCEVKVSLNDLRADGSKDFHFRAAHLLYIKREPKNYKEARAQTRAAWVTNWCVRLPNQFYFAVPDEFADKALEIINQRYPYTGLLTVAHHPERAYWGDSVTAIKVAPTLHKEKCSIRLVSHIAKGLTASLASAYKALVKATSKEKPEVEPKIEVS
jgi:hypothetical protein